MGNNKSKNNHNNNYNDYRPIHQNQQYIRSSADRNHMASKVEQRANKKRVKKKDLSNDHWQRYNEIGNPNSKEVHPERCTICRQEFENGEMLMIHMNQVHSFNNNNKVAPIIPTPTSISGGTVACPLCRRQFVDEMAVSLHFERDHNKHQLNEREKRAAVATARLTGKRVNTKSKAERKRDNWRRYNEISKDNNEISKDNNNNDITAEEEKAFELINIALQEFTKNSPELQEASLKMMQGILSRLCNSTIENRDKYRRIKMSNAKVQQKIVEVPGAIDLILAVGFHVVTLPSESTGDDEDYLLYEDNSLSFLKKVLVRLQERNNDE